MRYPDAKWIGTPNHFGYPAGTHGQLQPLAICDHIMCGTLRGCDAWFNGGGLSAHFGIGKNGDVHQYVELEDIAWANGSVANPDPALAYIYENYNPNVVTWSIEHEGWPHDYWTEAMYQADLKLKRWLLGRWPGLAIVGHYQFDSVNRNNCPGPNWPIERLIADLKEEDVATIERRVELLEEAARARAFHERWLAAIGTNVEAARWESYIDTIQAWRLKGNGWAAP
ncbi:unnamed protein product [marine sediment metagenome]|uniref:N-acetylmuramoyl-L-alanine amidase n=1 Tax=marine sediment metagenome TaxID=412755 RepID=X0VBF8_9ZZZZ